MTRSAQQPPTSAQAATGPDGEETAPAATAAAPEAAAEPEVAEPESPSEAAETTAGTKSATATDTDTDAESDTAAAAKSRLPALVRTMSATAIDKPRATNAVGRPGKAVLAGAAVAGALLVSVPFLVLGGDKDDNDRKETTAAGTVLGGDETESPGAFSEATPSTGASKDDKGDKDGKKSADTKDSGTKGAAPASPSTESGKTVDKPKSESAEKKAPAKKTDGKKNTPAKAGTVTFSAPMALRSHLAGRCLDVPAADFTDGKKLMMWDCNNGPAQQWQFASDGTVRIHGLCLDVANADFTPGTPMQIARCNGNDAQKFVLNEAHDLVNTVVGMCVDIKGSNPDNKAPVQLWTCNGADAQKWSV